LTDDAKGIGVRDTLIEYKDNDMMLGHIKVIATYYVSLTI